MKYKLLVLFLLFSIFCSAQENCNNGIDDDGDGKIDLNDSDCICNTTAITSIIPNPSFETHASCPSNFSELNLATPWIQATEATTDYFNTCGFIMPGVKDLGLQNFPDGDGIAGALFLTDWNEYLGAPLSSPMTAGTNYQLTFNIAALKIYNNGTLSTNSNVDSLEPVNVTLYGCANSKNLPLNIVSSPNLADPTWIEIGHATYTPISSWGEITISFTPSVTINAIMLGAPPVLPKSYPSMSGVDYPYFLYDNLLLNTSESFGVTITQSGNFCDSNLVLTATLTKPVSDKKTFQWYQNGIAIIGATNSSYSVPPFVTSLGQYSVKITDGSSCFVSTKLTINNTITGPNSTTIQPNCIVTTGSITVTTPAAQYSFDNGVTWQTTPTKDLLPVGTHYIKIKTPTGCISSATGVKIIEPQLLGNSDYTVIQPSTCDGKGTITINAANAAQYSFDDGVTWTTNATATDLTPGNYLIRIKDAAGCQSSSQYVIINQVYLNSPTFSVTQPTCGTGGTINITTVSDQYSFDDGITWTTNPIATNLAPGYYQVKIKNAVGCESISQYVTINTFYLDIYPTFTTTQPVCGVGGTITITTVAAEYSFDNGITWTTNPIATDLAPGTYPIMIKNDLGCISYSQYAYLNYFYLPNPTYTTTQPSCGLGGSITITSPGSEYSFDGGSTWTTNATATNLAPGTYYIMIKNNLGCTSNYEYVNLNYFYLPDPKYTYVNPSCGNIGSITITTPAAQYSFDGGLTWTTNPVATNLQAGSYYIKIKNNLGCESNYLSIYLDTFYLANPDYTVVQPACLTGGSITINTVADKYSFDGGNTWTNNPVATNLQPGYYYITIKNSSNCTSYSQYIYLEPFYLPNPDYTVIQPACGAGGSIKITTIADQYSFDGGNTWTTNPLASNLSSSYYYIMIKNNLGCTSNNQYVYLEPYYLPNPTFTYTQPTCGVGGSIKITTVADQYSFDNGNTWTTNSTATNLAPGYYYVLIKNNLGCVSNYQNVYIEPFYLPYPIFSVIQPTCDVAGSISISTIADQYSFDNGMTWTTNPVATNLKVGTYYILIKNNLGCVSNYSYTTIYESFLPNPTFSVIQPTCTNVGSITITTLADQYSFDNGNTWTTNPVATNLQNGYYYIKIKKNSGCQSDTQYVYIEYPPYIPTAPTVSTVKPTDCGTKNGSITITSYATSYSFDDGLTWGTNATLNALDAGTYLIRIKDSYGGCSSLATTVVLNAVNNTLAAPTYTVIQPTCSVNGTITITTVAAQYSFDNGITFGSSNSKSNLLPGTYFIKIKNNLGCVSASNSVVINKAPIPAAPIFTSTQPSCITPSGSITITTVAAEYSFDNGLTFTTSNTQSNLSSGTYLLKTKNSAGCISNSASANIAIVPVTPSQPSLTISQPLSCTALTGSISVTTPAAQYSFDNGLTWGSSSISQQLNPGSYYVKIRQTIGGCDSATTNAIINAPPNAPNIPLAITTQPTTCANPFGSITITSTAFAYSFNNGLTYSSSASSGLLTAGTYQLKVKNSSNCESDALIVKINAPLDYPIAPIFTIQQPDCSNPKGIITITSIASEYSFDNGLTWSNTAISTYLNSGNHLLKIKNSNGCISEATTANIIPFTNFPPRPTVTSPQTFCIQQNATISNLISTGQNIKWYDNNGILLSNTTVLQNNTTYYASQSINGCESQKEPVLVYIQNTTTPSGNPAQSLCTSQNPILSSITMTGTAIKWYDNNGMLLADSTPLQDGETYYATQTVNGCESIGKFAVTISLITTLPATNFEQSFCDDLNDGFEIMNLTSFNANLISIPTNYNFVYYASLYGAENQIASDAITSFLNYKLNVGIHKIYVRINTNNPCYAIAELKLNLISKPVIPIQDIVPICENNSITIDAGAGFSSYLWSTGATSQSIIVSKPGDFSVIVTTNYATISCSNTKNFTVKNSTVASITKIETQDWTDNENIITVFVTGQGNYEYTIDGTNYQDSNQFLALHSGEYTVTVKDKNGCGTDTEEVYLLMYPKFFTPNGDGYNDTWKIKFSDVEAGLTVKILDRYGKFIKELPNNTETWDGTYNGYQLPATDYWFVVTRTNGKEYKGHFSLKR